MVAEGLLNSIAICSDISLMRNVKLLIIDDWLNAEVDEKGVLLIKEVLDYRTNKVGTIKLRDMSRQFQQNYPK